MSRSARSAGGRPPKAPDLVAKGVRLVQQESLTPEEAAEKITAEQLKKLGKKASEQDKRRVMISSRTIRRAMEVQGGRSERRLGPVSGVGRGAPKPAAGSHPTSPAQRSPLDRLRGYAAHDPEALALLDDLDAEEAPEQIPTLERVQKLIAKVEKRAANAPPNRFAPLGGLLDRLYARERQLMGPPPPAPDAVLEALKGLDLDAIAKIEEHLLDRITPEELAAAPA